MQTLFVVIPDLQIVQLPSGVRERKRFEQQHLTQRQALLRYLHFHVRPFLSSLNRSFNNTIY
jgi:hypothetical protein